MKRLLFDIVEKIPANKFFPPRIDPAQTLYRKNIIDTQLNQKGRNKKIIVIEAQAGQGKTTLATQYVTECGSPFGWYQIGPEDADPALTLTALLSCLQNSLQKFNSPLLEKIIRTGDIYVGEIPRYANILLNDLAQFLIDDFLFVIDDFHLVKKFEATTYLFEHLINTSPPSIRFMLLSRSPIEIEGKQVKQSDDALIINNKTLALSEPEISILYNDIFKLEVRREDIKKLHTYTEGWVMGIILTAHAAEARHDSRSQGVQLPPSLVKQDILDFFRKEIFGYIPKNLYNPLLKLSFLDDIPAQLAEKITEDANFTSKLIRLNKQNFFIRNLDDANKTFSFHQLFKEFLRERAKKKLDPDAVINIYKEAAAYFINGKRTGEALRYMLKAMDYDAMEMTLEMFGMDLLAMNRSFTLVNILGQIDHEIIMKRGWLSFFLASALMQVAPPKALPLLINAIELFVREKNEIGELLATAQLIYFYMYCGGDYKTGAQYISRADELFAKHADQLDTYSKVLTAKNLAYGFCFSTSEHKKAQYYASLANKISTDLDLTNFMAATQGVLIFEKYFAGDLKACRDELETGSKFLYHPKVSELNRLIIFGALLNYLKDTGDYENFYHQERLLFECLQKELISSSIVGHYLHLWHINISILSGQPHRALQLIQEAVDEGSLLAKSNLYSQFLHFKAYALSLIGKEKNAFEAVQQSLQTMKKGGGNHYFIILKSLFIGATFIQLRLFDEAEPILVNALKHSVEHNQYFLRAAAYLQRGYLYLVKNENQKASQNIKKGIQCLRLSDLDNVYSLTPEILLTVLKHAFINNIEKNYAQKLAFKRLHKAILPNGEAAPIMDVHTFRELRFSLDGKAIFNEENLTRAQKELFGILITSPDLKISQDQLQFLLWPDSSPEKARGSLDTLLMRLRKSLNAAMKPYNIKNYLVLQKGFLMLKNCRIDVHEFNRKAEKGLYHVQKKQPMQASMQFYSAMNLWEGEFLNGDFKNEQLNEYRFESTQLFINASIEWAKILAKTGRIEEAITVAEQAMRYDRFNDAPLSLLYQLHQLNHQPLKAKNVLMRYEDYLRREEFSEEEIQVIIEAVINASIL